MSKGSGRRPAAVQDEQVASNWAAIFGERQRDQSWVEQDRAAKLAAANGVKSQDNSKIEADRHGGQGTAPDGRTGEGNNQQAHG